jgi:hypothetical protein
MHTNGYHNASNETVRFHGKKYEFVKGTMPMYFEWSFLTIVMYDLRNMLLDIVKSKPFRDAQHVVDPYISPERPKEWA